MLKVRTNFLKAKIIVEVRLNSFLNVFVGVWHAVTYAIEQQLIAWVLLWMLRVPAHLAISTPQLTIRCPSSNSPHVPLNELYPGALRPLDM